ncbi:MAG: hypothetical protein WAQ27_05625 [Candidatus Microsaccharimonas sp.]
MRSLETKTPAKDKYNLLQEGYRRDGTFKSVEELEMEYVDLTDGLIQKMTHGIETTPGSGEFVLPTKVIFLDKSARPLAWLTRELWDTLAPEPGSTEVPKIPDFKFLNIHRDPWKDMMDPNGLNTYTPGAPNFFDASHLPDKYIKGLRSVYDHDNGGSFEVPNEMDGQVILVVDEVRGSGATLAVATELLQTAFPTSIVSGTHWMDEMRDGTHRDQPPWYRNDETNIKLTPGRGVGNRAPRDDKPWTHFLSTPFKEPDQRANRLREDFKKLATSLKDKEILYVPLASGWDQDQEARAEHLNERSVREAVMARRAIQQADTERTKKDALTDAAFERKQQRKRAKEF